MKIAITGNIGSGKSTLAKTLACLGACYFDADAEAKKLYQTPEVRNHIVHRIDSNIYNQNQINWAYLKTRFFKDSVLRTQLEEFLHPLVFKAYQTFEELNHNSVCLFESALIFEKNRSNAFKYIVLVTAPETIRLERVLKRGGTKDFFDLINAHQLPDYNKINNVTHPINNDGVKPILNQLIEWMNQWKTECANAYY